MNPIDLLKEIRAKKDTIKEGTQSIIPLGGMDPNAVGKAFDELLDPRNIRQTSCITPNDSITLACLNAYSMIKSPDDLDGFVFNMTHEFLELQASVDGWRADSLRDLTSGIRYQEQQERIARIRSGNNENRDLDGV